MDQCCLNAQRFCFLPNPYTDWNDYPLLLSSGKDLRFSRFTDKGNSSGGGALAAGNIFATRPPRTAAMLRFNVLMPETIVALFKDIVRDKQHFHPQEVEFNRVLYD